MKTTEETWEWIKEREIATESELVLVTCINGYSVETLESVIKASTGYQDIEQYEECEG